MLADDIAPQLPPPATPRHPLRYHVQGIIGGALLGAIVAVAGTLVHRQWYPVMLIAALILTVSAGVWAVSWRRAAAGAGYVTVWSVTALVLASYGPGGDVLVAGDSWGGAPVAAGMIWMNVGTVCAVLPLLLLGRWARRWLTPRPDIVAGPTTEQVTASQGINVPGGNYAESGSTFKQT